MMEYKKPVEHIHLKETRFGTKPVISGRSVTVENIGVIYENDPDIEWIAENYDLTHAQIHAALAYFYDNREAFEEKINRAYELSEQIGIPLDVFLNTEKEPEE